MDKPNKGSFSHVVMAIALSLDSLIHQRSCVGRIFDTYMYRGVVTKLLQKGWTVFIKGDVNCQIDLGLNTLIPTLENVLWQNHM